MNEVEHSRKRKRRTAWTFERVLKEARNDMFDYSEIRKEHVQSSRSRVPITCKECGSKWFPTLETHFYKVRGCEACSARAEWSLVKIMRYGRHNLFDYSEIRDEDLVNGSKSKIPLSCKKCLFKWSTSIDIHFIVKSGCPNCPLKRQWTLAKILERGNHALFDYSEIRKENVKNVSSKIPLTCKTCGYKWIPSVQSHFCKKMGCPNCSRRSEWTLEKVFKHARHTFFDYSEIREYDLTSGVNSRIPIRCKKCNLKWSPSIKTHFNTRCGCPQCNMSKGEIQCQLWLEKQNITFEAQAKVSDNSHQRYDFRFNYNEQSFILEFDGQQHFYFHPSFHKTEQGFKDHQQRDIYKSKLAIQNGEKIIRIDYTCLAKVHEYLDAAMTHLSQANTWYFSSSILYKYIEDELRETEL